MIFSHQVEIVLIQLTYKKKGRPKKETAFAI